MIYFAQAGLAGPIKIGFAKDPSRRVLELQTGCPEQIYLLAQMDGERDAEAAWHLVLRTARLRGEWFRPRPVVEVLTALGYEIPATPLGREFPCATDACEACDEPRWPQRVVKESGDWLTFEYNCCDRTWTCGHSRLVAKVGLFGLSDAEFRSLA